MSRSIFQNRLWMQWLWMWCCCLVAIGGDTVWGQAKKPSDVVAQYLEETTLGIAWCDVEKLEVSGIASLLATYNLPVEESAYKFAENIAAGLKSQGVIKVYCVFDVSALMESRPPVFVLQVKEGSDLSIVQALITPLTSGANLSVVKDGELLLVGDPKDLARKQTHPTAKLVRLQKQMAAANPSNAICIAPSSSLAEALRVTMNLGGGEAASQPFAVKLLLVFIPMEGLRVDSSIVHKGLNAVVDFDTAEKANKFKQDVATLLAELKQVEVERVLPKIREASAVWELENQENFSEFFKGISARLTDAASKNTSMNNLKQLALALHNHESAFTFFPPQALTSPSGKKLLSWRVMILPFLEQNELYQKFKLDEPWDSAHNAALIKEMPKVFARPNADPTLGKTPYVAPLTKDSFFGRPGAPPGFKDILDGTSNTVWMIEAPPELEVVWTKPEDWEVKGAEAIDQLLKLSPELLVSQMDGSVQLLPATITSDIIMKMLTIAGGEVVNF